MKDAINYFIPIVKDPMNDITGRCMTNHGLDSAYCGTYHQNVALRNANTHQSSNDTGLHYPDVQMETNSMEIQYNNLIEIDDYQECQQKQQREIPQQPTRKRNNFCENESSACAKRCRVENADPSIFLPSDQSTPPIVKSQSHQRQPTHNMPDMPRCMMVFSAFNELPLSKSRQKDNKTCVPMNDSSIDELLMCIHGCSTYHWRGDDI